MNAQSSGGYQHDFDEELGCYWYGDPPSQPRPLEAHRHRVGQSRRPIKRVPPRVRCAPPDPPPLRRARNEAYWDEAGDLLLDYFELQAGALDSESLVDGFVAWLKRSPAEFRQYTDGDDMTRATLVDWYLRVVR
jgi:hypothetical protein